MKKIVAAIMFLLGIAILYVWLVPDNIKQIIGAKTGVTCEDPGQGAFFFWNGIQSYQRGQQVALTPFHADMPGDYTPLTDACVRNVRLSNPDIGTPFQRDDGRMALRIHDDAPLGVMTIVSADYQDHSIAGRIAIYDPDTMPLVGFWSQNTQECDPDSIIRKLVFNADGTFSVTWEPFEVYKDYWGDYTFDTQSGQLTLDVKSGNVDVLDLSSGTVKFQAEPRSLTLETASFGRRGENVAECRSSFE